MEELNKRFAALGIKLPEILLPSPAVDMNKWSVIACDQFSSEKGYWEKVKRQVGSAPSTLNLILPECYLKEKDTPGSISRINENMRSYLSNGVLRKLEPGFVLVDRKTSYVPSRKGIVLAVDLEFYDFKPDTRTLIRPTEGTIISRLPPRVNIRKNAALDLPHILFLIDDPEFTVIEEAAKSTEAMELLYDFELMEDGGHVTGRKIDDPLLLEKIVSALEKLREKTDFLFAVGDGNHSLAAAKTIWEEIKKEGNGDVSDHPARWALVEVENIYGVMFEPIHRVMFNISAKDFISFLDSQDIFKIDYVSGPGLNEVFSGVEGGDVTGFISSDLSGTIAIRASKSMLTVDIIQKAIDTYLEKNQEIELEYIHGEESASRLGKQSGNLALILPPVDKSSFFQTIRERGSLPRKTFSIGEAREKRYYLESRRLVED